MFFCAAPEFVGTSVAGMHDAHQSKQIFYLDGIATLSEIACPKRGRVDVTLVASKTSSLSEFAVANTGRLASLEFSWAKCSTQIAYSRLRVTKPHTRRICLAA